MRRLRGPAGRVCPIFVACWGVPAAAFCALAFAGGFAPSQSVSAEPSWLAGPLGSVLAELGLLYGVFWLSLPVTLLVIGIGQLRLGAAARWRWPAAWTAAVLAGMALDPLALWASNTTYSGEGFEWPWLALGTAYLALSAAMFTLLIAAKRTSARASVRSPYPLAPN
jgi:hypothetical protein